MDLYNVQQYASTLFSSILQNTKTLWDVLLHYQIIASELIAIVHVKYHLYDITKICVCFRVAELLEGKGAGKKGRFQGKANKLQNRNLVENLLKDFCASR